MSYLIAITNLYFSLNSQGRSASLTLLWRLHHARASAFMSLLTVWALVTTCVSQQTRRYIWHHGTNSTVTALTHLKITIYNGWHTYKTNSMVTTLTQLKITIYNGWHTYKTNSTVTALTHLKITIYNGWHTYKTNSMVTALTQLKITIYNGWHTYKTNSTVTALTHLKITIYNGWHTYKTNSMVTALTHLKITIEDIAHSGIMELTTFIMLAHLKVTMKDLPDIIEYARNNKWNSDAIEQTAEWSELTHSLKACLTP